MPLNGRNYLDLANFANGVHGAATRGDLSINGQLGRNIDYVVDGVSNKVIEWGDASKTGLSLDVVQEFQVITSQFSAEFGHRSAGSSRRSPRAAPTSFTAPATSTIGPGALDAKNGLTGTRTPFNQQQFGGVLSGPIVRDRTHFIGSFEGTNQDSELVVTSVAQAGRVPGDAEPQSGLREGDAPARRQPQRAAALQPRRQPEHQRRRLRRPGAARRRHQEQARQLGAAGDGDQRAVVEHGERGAVPVFAVRQRVDEPRARAARDLHRPRHLRREPRARRRTSARTASSSTTSCRATSARTGRSSASTCRGSRRPACSTPTRSASTPSPPARRTRSTRGNPATYPGAVRAGVHRSAAADLAAPRLRAVRLCRHRPLVHQRRPVRAGRLGSAARVHAEPRRALREADLVARQQQHHAAHRLCVGPEQGRPDRRSRRLRPLLRPAVRQHSEHRGSVRHHRQLLDHADAGRQPRRVSRRSPPC